MVRYAFSQTLQLVALIATTVLLGACAGNPDTADTMAADNHASNLDCRTIRVTGSRLGEKVCKRPGQWEIESAEQKEAIERLQRDSSAVTGGSD